MAMLTTVYKPPMARSLFENLYRNMVLKPSLRLLRRRGSYPTFWTMPDDIICREILLNGYYEKELLLGMTAIVTNKSGTVLDVGANIGNHSIFFARAFKHVVSFEPVARNCCLLKANLHLNRVNNVTLVAKGLSDTSGFLFVTQDDSRNTNVGLSTNSQGPLGPRDRVEVVRGDDELKGVSYPTPVTMIKIDVEGMEPKVIQGLENTIREHRPTIFWEATTEQGALATVSRLEQMGYENFYHLTTNRFRRRYINKLVNFFGRSTYIIPLDECNTFDGLNAALWKPIK